MKSSIKIMYLMLITLFLWACIFALPAWGKDIRLIPMAAEKMEAAMKEKAALELHTAKQAAALAREEITRNRQTLDRAIARLTDQAGNLEKDIKVLETENETLARTDKDLSQKLDHSQGMVKELSGVIRMNAKDIDTFLTTSFLSGVYHPDTAFLKAIAEESVFPGMDHIRKMADLLFERIRQGRAVSLETAPIVDRTGKTVEARVLVLGSFTAAYGLAAETGFLSYTQGEGKLFALSRLPSAGMGQKIAQYMGGNRDAVPMDISRGAALSQLTYKLSLWDQVPKGGPIVWPILAILAVGSLLALERLWFLLRRKIRLETVVSQIETLALAQNWQACQEICAKYAKSPVIRVIRAGLSSRELPREDMENTVQEAILREIPPMERFLSTMGMLAAIAPLLGLLGTVTGMIDTFHVITMHGTGDPRMMSGGISEALVTTMLGLAVAIPIMLAHTLLTRAVENNVGLMEEKAVALINVIQKLRGELMDRWIQDILMPTVDLIRAGGVVMTPLIVLSLVMWLLIVERALFFRRLYRRNMTSQKALSLIRRDQMPDPAQYRGAVSLLVAEFIRSRTGNNRLDRHLLDAAVARINRRLSRFLALIGVLAAMAPLLGLLGTVTGMITTFDVLAIFGTGNAKAMAGGISQSLITTQTGLIVAIPGLYMKGFLDRRADTLSQRILRVGLYLKRHV